MSSCISFIVLFSRLPVDINIKQGYAEDVKNG